MNNILNNNTNIIMIIMALILIGLMIYIIKITRKENKEGFANASSTFGGMTFDWDETSKTLNITGGKVNIPGITKLSNTDISGATNINGNIIDTSGNLFNNSISTNSIKIGGATLSWDSVNNRLVLDKGIQVADNINTSKNINASLIYANNITLADTVAAQHIISGQDVATYNLTVNGKARIDTIRWRAGENWY